MLLKSQKSKQRIVEVKKFLSNLINIAVRRLLLRGEFYFTKNVCAFSKKFPIKYQRHVGFYVLSLATYQREKFIFCDLALLASFHRLLLEGIKFFRLFSKFCDSEKQRGAIVEQKFPLTLPVLLRFAAYHLEGLLISRAKISEKVSNEQQWNENNV